MMKERGIKVISGEPEVRKNQERKQQEVNCSKLGCDGVLDMHRMKFISLSLVSCPCTICGKYTKLTRTYTKINNYNRNKDGSLKRKIPKNKLSKKDRKRINKQLRMDKNES